MKVPAWKMCSNHTNADMNCTVYKGFIDNKTKLWVWIDLFYFMTYFLALWLSCGDSSALLCWSAISFIRWSSCPDTSIICSLTSFSISAFSPDFEPVSQAVKIKQLHHLGVTQNLISAQSSYDLWSYRACLPLVLRWMLPVFEGSCLSLGPLPLPFPSHFQHLVQEKCFNYQ